MEKNFKYGALFIMGLMMASCEESGWYGMGSDSVLSLSPHYLSISKTDFSVGAQANNETTYVQALSTPWNFNGYADWIDISPSSGNQDANVTLNFAENKSGVDSRTSVFSLVSTDSDWKRSIPISVSQTHAIPMLEVDEDYLTYSGAGETKQVSVTTNCTLSSTNYYDWISVKVAEDNKSVDISVSPNSTGYARTGSFTLNANFVSKYISIYQSVAAASVTESSLNFENTAGTYTLAVTSEADWTARSSQSWISLNQTSGSKGTSNLEISVSPWSGTSTRTGIVSIAIGSSTLVQIKVTQKGLYLDVTGNYSDFASVGETRELNVSSNNDWTVKSEVDWITLDKSTGNGNGTVKFSVKDNPSLSSRGGYVNFTSSNSALNSSKYVTQKGKAFSVNQTLVNLSDKAESAKLTITADAKWTAVLVENYDWLTITPTAANNSTTMTITATENKTTSERMGYIDITMYDKKYHVAVHQDSKYFNVTSPSLKFTSKGGSSDISVATNDAWSASVEANKGWIHIDKTSGTGTCKLTVKLDDNATVVSRKGYVDVKSNNAGTVRLNYEQAARFLTVDRSDFTFFPKGGTSIVATISTDGTYEITQTGGWFYVTKGDNNTFTVTATENTTKEERTGSVTFTMKGLTDGSISVNLPVKQVGSGYTFTIGDFSSDEKWDLSNTGSLKVSVVGFSADKNWNVTNQSGTVLNFTGYGNDNNWDTNSNSNGTIVNSGYGNDNNWNN